MLRRPVLPNAGFGAKPADAQVDPGFAVLLVSYDLAALNQQDNTVLGVWPDGSIALLNRAWFQFARANDGHAVIERWQLGDSMLLAISEPLRSYYATQFARVLSEGMAWEHTYSCHAPDERREYRLLVQSLEGRGLLITHSLAFTALADHPGAETADLERYTSAEGLVRQCSNCRRIKRATADEAWAWDWVRDAVVRPPSNTSHGLCPACFGHYAASVASYAARLPG